MRIAAVIVTYNRLQKLKHTLACTLAEPLDRVIVIDNASTDTTPDWLHSVADPRLTVIRLPVNAGGAGGFARGFEVAASDHSMDWLVCFDDDAWPQAGAISAFRDTALAPDVAGAAAAVYLPTDAISEMNRPSLNPFASWQQMLLTLSKGRMGFHVDDAAYKAQGVVPIDYSSFVGCFLRTAAVRSHLALPRSELFIYADDILYTFGIRQAGFQHVFVPAVHFTHDCGTLVNQQDVYKPLWRAFYSYRNRLELFRTLSGHWFPLVVMLKLPGWVAKMRHYERPGLFLKVLARAVCDGLKRDFTRSHADIQALSKE